jgi:hypothetical protein
VRIVLPNAAAVADASVRQGIGLVDVSAQWVRLASSNPGGASEQLREIQTDLPGFGPCGHGVNSVVSCLRVVRATSVRRAPRLI